MQAVLDIKSARSFAESLEKKRTVCNDEGMFCSDLDKSIRCQFEIANQLNHAIGGWAQRVFSGKASYDPDVEKLLLAEVDRVLESVQPLIEQGEDRETECYTLAYLQALQNLSNRLLYLKTNWVTPQRSIAPSPRVQLSEAAAREIAENAADMSSKGLRGKSVHKS